MFIFYICLIVIVFWKFYDEYNQSLHFFFRVRSCLDIDNIPCLTDIETFITENFKLKNVLNDVLWPHLMNAPLECIIVHR